MTKGVSPRLGAFGIASGVLMVIATGMIFAGGTPQSADAATITQFLAKNRNLYLAVVLLDSLNIACLVIFLGALRGIVIAARADSEWAATLMFGSGLVWGVLTLIFDILFGGAVLDTQTKTDPLVAKALSEGAILTYGAVGLVVGALFLGSAGFMARYSSTLPGWLGWAGYIGAALSLLAAPSIFGGVDINGFYTSNGIAPIVFGLTPIVVWVIGAGIAMMRKSR